MDCGLHHYQEVFQFNGAEKSDYDLVNSSSATAVFSRDSTKDFFGSLPLEMIIEIFSYLNGNDLKYAALVCRRFLDALTLRKFTKNFVFNFTDTFYKEFSVQISSFSNPSRIIPAVSLATGNFDIASEAFWIENGEFIKELFFKSGVLNKEEFQANARYTPNLETLTIEKNNLFHNWDIKENYQERLFKFRKCRHLGLPGNQYLNKKIFNFLTGLTPNLQELDMSNCLGKLSNFERTQFLDHLMFYIKGYASNLKLLDLSHTIVDDLFLQQLAEIEDLKLKSLSLTFNGNISNKNYGLIPLLVAQTELEQLTFVESPAIEETILILVGKHMKNLKNLNLEKCVNITNYCIRELSKLPVLELLNITGCEYVDSNGIFEGLVSGRPKRRFRKLYMGYLPKLCDETLFKLGPRYENQLTHLDIRGSTHITDSGLQTIFKCFNSLRYLNVESCCKISDFGFTGNDVKNGKQYNSISDLKGLRVLKCGNIFKMTNLSLIKSFELIDLKDLHMARCHISDAGIESLVTKCPSIEYLDLSECDKITDSTVEIITKHLRRLQTLKLNGCLNLTDKSLDHIYENCQEIKNLYIRNCKNLKTDRITDQLYYMRTLRKVCLMV